MQHECQGPCRWEANNQPDEMFGAGKESVSSAVSTGAAGGY